MHDQRFDKILEVGVDYITATCRSGPSAKALAGFGAYLVKEEANKGAKVANYRGTGYYGLHAGSAAYGSRADGSLVRLSSGVAAEHWAQLYVMADNVTRLDLQVTVVPWDGPYRRLARNLRQVKRVKHGRGRPFKHHLHSGELGPETLELGRRTSDQWGRIYNKGLQSKVAYYLGALRYEVQFNRHFALQMCEHLDQQSAQLGSIAAEVDAWFRNHHVAGMSEPALTVNIGRAALFPVHRSRSDQLDRQLTWLAVQIKPTLDRLTKAGLGHEVRHALGFAESAPLVQPSQADQYPDWSN